MMKVQHGSTTVSSDDVRHLCKFSRNFRRTSSSDRKLIAIVAPGGANGEFDALVFALSISSCVVRVTNR
jgi:hypothetical protein